MGTAFALILSAFIIFSIPMADAATTYGLADIQDLVSKIDNLMTGPYQIIYDTLNGTGIYANFYNFIINDDGITAHSTGFDSTYGIGMATGAYQSLCVLGILLAVAFAMIRLFQNLERGADPMESIFKILIEICIVSMIMINVDAIMKWICRLGTYICELLNDSVTSTSASINSIDIVFNLGGLKTPTECGGLAIALKQLEDVDVPLLGIYFWKMGIKNDLLIPELCTIVCKIIAQFVVIQLMFELGIRKLFAPFAIADIYGEGLRSPGMRYMKKYLEVFIKMAICLMVSVLGGSLMTMAAAGFTDPNVGFMETMFAIIATEFTCMGVMLKAGEYANDIVGV